MFLHPECFCAIMHWCMKKAMTELPKIITGCREDGVAETVCRRSTAFPRELRPELTVGFAGCLRYGHEVRLMANLGGTAEECLSSLWG